jgi:hypothetical protein
LFVGNAEKHPELAEAFGIGTETMRVVRSGDGHVPRHEFADFPAKLEIKSASEAQRKLHAFRMAMDFGAVPYLLVVVYAYHRNA